MARYLIDVIGCDDTTSVDMELNDAEVPTVVRIVNQCCLESQYGCQPKMRLSTFDGTLARWVAGKRQ